LNLQYGISHQDIAPRNLAIDGSTDSIMVFDFNISAHINRPHSPADREFCLEERNDIKGVMFTSYEIITQDDSLRRKPHKQQNLDEIAFEWEKHPEVNLDHPLTSYQLILQEWRQWRANIHTMSSRTFPMAINWPSKPKPPPVTIPYTDIHGKPASNTINDGIVKRQDMLALGSSVVNWERPPQRLLDGGLRVLASGKVIGSEKDHT
jgi:hypothetical protein